MLDRKEINSGRITPEERFVEHALSINAIQLLEDGLYLSGGHFGPYRLDFSQFKPGDSLTLLATKFIQVAEKHFMFDTVYAVSEKDIPLATIMAHHMNNHVGLAFDNKSKTSTQRFKGKQVLLVTDTLSVNHPADIAMCYIREHGGEPVGCIIAFNTQETTTTGYSAVQSFGYNHRVPVYALSGMSDLVSYLEKTKSDDERSHQTNIANLKKHQQTYGVQLG